jgi:hypothetical protein
METTTDGRFVHLIESRESIEAYFLFKVGILDFKFSDPQY